MFRNGADRYNMRHLYGFFYWNKYCSRFNMRTCILYQVFKKASKKLTSLQKLFKIGTFIYPIDNWLLAIWAMQKTWAEIPSRANRIKHLARTTIWRPKQMTCDDQIKLTFGALAASCTSCSIWKSFLIFAIPLSCAFQLLIL